MSKRRRRPSLTRVLLGIVVALIFAAIATVLVYRGLLSGIGSLSDNSERTSNCLDWEREHPGEDLPDC